MNELQLLTAANQYVNTQRDARLSKQWLNINDRAHQAYKKVRETLPRQVRHELPGTSPELLQRCDPSDVTSSLIQQLRRYSILDKRLPHHIEEYIGFMQQLIAVSRQLTGASDNSALAAGLTTENAPSGMSSTDTNVHPAPARPGATNAPAEPGLRDHITSTRTPVDVGGQNMEGRAIFKEHGGEQDDFRHSGGGLSLPALYRTPDELQQKLTQHVEGAHAHIEQLISVASDAMEQINLLQQHMRRVTVEYMPKGEYERIFGQLHVLNATQGERWKDIALQIIAIICDLERQYNPSDTGNDARVQSAEMMFDRAIRTVVNQLDTLLAKTFGVTRIPAEHNAGFNSKTMVAEPYEEELLSPDMAGNIAHVIEPGYWRKLPDGTLELYHRVRVRRYKSSQLHKEI